MNTPDKPSNPEQCYDRAEFRVGGRVFNRIEPGKYTYGDIVVYCDQQDSQSWAARIGAMRTGYYWYPEYAVLAALRAK